MELPSELRLRIERALSTKDAERALRFARMVAAAWSVSWAGLLGVASGIVLFCAAGHDDSHITLWAAYALAEFGEIVNHSGDRLEQSSSLLHTLVLALAYGVTGIRLAWLAYGLGIAFAVMTVIRLPRVAGLHSSAGPLRLAAATSPLLTYWALAGLESTLFCWVSVEFLIASSRLLEPRGIETRSWVAPVVWSGLLAMTRPEATIVASCAVAAVVPFAWWRERRCGTRAAAFLVVQLGLGAVLMAWRLSYFGDPLPHPVSAKMGPNTDSAWQLWLGTRQLFNLFLRADTLPMLAGVIGGVIGLAGDLRERNVTRPLVVAFGGAYLCFIVFAGGDWMLGGRFLAHIAPVLTLLFFVVFGVESWPRRRAWALAIAIMVANSFQAVAFSGRESMGRPIWNAWQVLPTIEANAGARDFTWVELVNKPHGRDAIFLKELDPVLDRVVESEGKVSIVSVQAGMVMFYVAQRHYGHLEFADQAGLASRHYDEVVEELGVPHARLGFDWSLSDVLELGEHREGPEFQPDLIFDLYGESRNAARQHGYNLIFVQGGSMLSAYTPPEEEDEDEDEDEDEAEKFQRLTDEERTVERLREKFAKKVEDREVNFWRAKKGFYQFIAVRREIAQRVGWERAERDANGVTGRIRRRFKRWRWDEIRTEHMRYFEDEESDDAAADEKGERKTPAKKARTEPPEDEAEDGSEDDSSTGADEDATEDETGDDGPEDGEDDDDAASRDEEEGGGSPDEAD